LPLHLINTLSNERVPDIAIYSDTPEQLGHKFEITDALVNESDLIRIYDPSAYNTYQEL
jgi:hypothetical protein